MTAVSGFLDEVIGGIEVGCDVLGVHISHGHLQLLEALGYLQILWVVVDADQPAHSKRPSCLEHLKRDLCTSTSKVQVDRDLRQLALAAAGVQD